MKINKIIKLKNGKYKIKLDEDELTTYSEVIIENNILYKKEVDNGLYNTIIDMTIYYDIYYKCLKHIDKKIRSKKEIEEYLKKQGSDPNTIEKIINKLEDINLINDSNFARAYINDKIYLSNYGINKIRQELLINGVNINIIEEELDKIDKNELKNKLKKIINKRLYSNKKYSIYQLKQKIINDMIILGYDKEDIIDIINNYEINDDDILLKEYNRLKNKYDLNKLKQKLLSKGFSYEQINSIIKKEEF